MELFCFLNYTNDFLVLLMNIIGSIFILIISPILFLINLKRNKQFKKGKNIVITGASSGLGRSLALHYSKNPGVKLGLIGRDTDRLEKVKNECLKNGAEYVEIVSIDVSNQIEMEKFLNDFNKRIPIDIIYANAAVNELILPKELSFTERSNKIVDINVYGLLNTVLPMISIFESRRGVDNGQIVLISSVGPMTNFVFPTYNGTKAFVTSFGLTLRNRLNEQGIGVSVVVPGYIETPMAHVLDQKELMFSVTPEYAANKTIEGVQFNKGLITFSRSIYMLSVFFSLFPPNFAKDSIDFILSKFISFPDHNKPISPQNKKKD
ncbi:hypothetical protein RB653_008726 [Dictyostelium firmibasis]|uniref:Uncharacterized protein n=1 Tax=Dictyostelium firmibasis TaxID=79012 RepID=A0AAN7UD31_9MYCE